MSGTRNQTTRTSLHWGAYDVEVEDDRIVGAQPWAADPDPSPIGQSIPTAVHHKSRVTQPMVRRRWLESKRPDGRQGRGTEPFVPVSWEYALDLVAGELQRVRTTYGNKAIYGGSYGWSSAGRFHHAGSQVHRFLNKIGGYVSSVNSYSAAASEVVMPHVIGGNFGQQMRGQTAWPVIAKHTDLYVTFGGIPLKNAQVSQRGAGAHTTRDWLMRCRVAGVEFVNIGVLRSDTVDFLDAEWLAPRPNTDTALMLGIAHTLVIEELCDRQAIETYTVGYDRFEPYLLGESDGQPKDAEWAARITGVGTEEIKALARRMASGRTMINVSLSLQRSDHGEQPYWMATVVSEMLGQVGVPGGGVGFGYGTFGYVGRPVRRVDGMALSQGENAVKEFIPVARIADMLLHPGEKFDYNGKRLTYPDIRLIYWCGGNPFHHHQDLNRLVEAWQRPETIIVNEPWWNSVAKHADIVLPATTPLGRNDISRAPEDPYLFAMQQAIPPVGEARNDFDIFSELAIRMGTGDSFTEGRNEDEWLRHLWGAFRDQVAGEGFELPVFDDFWQAGHAEIVAPDDGRVFLGEFRNDPVNQPLATPSGKVEIYSEEIASFEYDDCPGHPTWMEPAEWLGSDKQSSFPLHLISNQPSTRLHSQHDPGSVSVASKVNGREPITIHTDDAASRGLEDGDVVRVFNDRGECLAGVQVSDGVWSGVVVLPTGAWYDPVEPGGLDAHGNPNVLTLDKGTSRLAQGPVSQTALVEVEKFIGDLPPVRAFDPPDLSSTSTDTR